MKRNWQPFIATLLMVLFGASAQATTYYVRTDGGVPGTCKGTSNAPASAAPSCAWNNLQWAIPPGFPTDGAKPTVLQTGDTVQIAAGTYPEGYGTPGAVACQANYAYNCIYNPNWNVPLPPNMTIA